MIPFGFGFDLKEWNDSSDHGIPLSDSNEYSRIDGEPKLSENSKTSLWDTINSTEVENSFDRVAPISLSDTSPKFQLPQLQEEKPKQIKKLQLLFPSSHSHSEDEYPRSNIVITI